MTFQHVFWAGEFVEYGARLSTLENFDEGFELTFGIAHSHDFPDSALFRMHPDFPDDTVLTDRLTNSDSLVVISTPLKSFLAGKLDAQTELLEVKVLDHRGRETPQPYYIVNPVDAVDCLDLDACDIVAQDDFRIEKMNAFSIDDAALPSDRVLFRIQRLVDYVVVPRELAQAIDAAGFTGNRWVEPAEFLGKYIPPDLSSLPPRDVVRGMQGA